MAENKKSIIVYADWLKKFEAISDDEAGRLIKHFFRYVNDLNPKAPDRITELLFIDIEQSLKRDLIKWEKRAERSRINGLNGGRPSKNATEEKPKETQQVISEPRKPDSDSVSVSVNVSVSDNDILLKKETKNNITVFDFKKSLIKYGFEKQLVEDWMKVRKTKKATNTETAFNAFIKEIESKTCNINEMLQIAVTNSWSGFKHKWIENLKTTIDAGTKSNTEIFEQSVAGETARSFNYGSLNRQG